MPGLQSETLSVYLSVCPSLLQTHTHTHSLRKWPQMTFQYALKGNLLLAQVLSLLIPEDHRKDIGPVLFQSLLRSRPHIQKGYVQIPLLLLQEAVFPVGKGSSNNQLGNLEF